MLQWPLLHQPRLQPTPHQCQKVPVFLVTKVDWAFLGLPAVVLLYPHQRQVHFNFWKKQRQISETLQDENDQGLGGTFIVKYTVYNYDHLRQNKMLCSDSGI